jgi:hypothetical protein
VPEEPQKENRLCVSNIDLKDGAVHAGWQVPPISVFNLTTATGIVSLGTAAGEEPGWVGGFGDDGGKQKDAE